jgi:hypothetical protein
MIAPRRKCPSSRHASGRCRVSSRLRALHWHPDPTPRLIPARARSSASSHLASAPYPAHASSLPASVPYPCRAHRHVSSRLRAALASRARPAASPHPDCPPCPAPRLIPASLPAAAACAYSTSVRAGGLRARVGWRVRLGNVVAEGRPKPRGASGGERWKALRRRVGVTCAAPALAGLAPALSDAGARRAVAAAARLRRCAAARRRSACAAEPAERMQRR